MDRRDGRVQRICAEAPRLQRAFDQRFCFGDLRAIPARAILVFEQHQFTGRRGARLTPRFVQQHQCE